VPALGVRSARSAAQSQGGTVAQFSYHWLSLVLVRLREWAQREGVAYITAWRWWNEGKLPVPARKVGKLILVDVPEPVRGRTIVYARVSSADQKPDLDGQVARVVAWCGGRSLPVDGTVTEIGPAAAAGTRLPRAVLARQVQLTPLARFS